MTGGEILRIEPGAAERVARAFDTHAHNLEEVLEKLRAGSYTTGFAGFPSAVELDAGFVSKRNMAVDHLRAQIDATRSCAATIRAAGHAYVAADATGLTAIRSADEDLPGDPR